MSKKRLVIFGNTNDYIIANSLLSGRNFEMVGGVIDCGANAQSKEKQRMFLSHHNLTEVQPESLNSLQTDVVLCISYHRLIPMQIFSGIMAFNIHGGLLPKWWGLNAGCWAMLNGEKELGYTLHKIDEGCDSGPIYHTFTDRIGESEYYYEVIKRVRKQVSETISNLLADIINGTLEAKTQNGARCVYTTPLKPQMGEIRDWNIKTDYLYSLYRVLGAPYGTGIFCHCDDQRYEITKMSKIKWIDNYIGSCGVVVLRKQNSVLVKTADSVIAIDKIKQDNRLIAPSSLFRVGQKLL
jgi:methionyl-tRNA formyltransferase